MLKEAAIAACDAQDGVTDRVIGRPDQCRYDPAAAQCAAGQSGTCLSPSEVAAAKRIYAGVADARGQIVMPGTGPGSEPLWGAYASPGFAIGTDVLNVVMNDPAWDPATFDASADLARAERIDNGAGKAMDPDLSAFIARGGKLITYHGTTDGLIPFGNTVNYYESVVAKVGKTAAADSVRLYLVPGMDHCSGGEGAFAVDWLTPLENWAEKGEAPAALPAAHPATVPGLPGASGVEQAVHAPRLCLSARGEVQGHRRRLFGGQFRVRRALAGRRCDCVDGENTMANRGRQTLALLLASGATVCASAQPAPDRAAIEAEALRHFQALVRMDTSDPPGGREASRRLPRARARKRGHSGRSCSRSSASAERRRAAEGLRQQAPAADHGAHRRRQRRPEKWTHPPFGAVRDGGYVYGRGTVDDKDNVTAALMVMLMLKRATSRSIAT